MAFNPGEVVQQDFGEAKVADATLSIIRDIDGQSPGDVARRLALDRLKRVAAVERH